MASNKLEMSKRDMNFFSEFTGSSGQATTFLPYVLLTLIGIIVVCGAVFGFLSLQTATVNAQIDKLNTEINSEENQGKLKEYTDTYNSMSAYNLQYYDLSSLFSTVKNTTKVDSTVMDAVYKNLPSDIFITGFTYEGGKVQLVGNSNSYFSPLSFLASLRTVSLFTNVEITSIKELDFSSSTLSPEEIAASNKFSFDITGYLKETYPVVTSRLIDDTTSTPLTAVDSQTKNLGEKYEIKGINTYTSDNGTVYALSRVMVNNVALTDAQLAAVKEADSLSGIANAATDIKIYYVVNGGAQA